VLGGNPIVLRTAFAASGADAIVLDRLGDDSLVYAGYSAGGCILGPPEALSVSSYGDPLPGYPDDPVETGLGLVPFALVPHFDPQTSASAGLADHYLDHHVPFIALRDGQAVVVDDDDDVRVVE